MKYEEAMSKAIDLARTAAVAGGDVPIGAIVLNGNGDLIATGANQRELLKDATAHAEIIAIKRASSAMGSWRLEDCTLVVTLEPCGMCAGAIAQARMKRVVFGAWDEKAGAVGSQWDLLRDPRQLHKPEVVGGIMEEECAKLLKDFFVTKRD